MKRGLSIFGLLAISASWTLFAFGRAPKNNTSLTVNAPMTAERADAIRVEGEKRFHANCGRCHMSPQKFSPRVIATAVRHMRVRATITDEDMRLILFYMSQ